MRFSSFKGKRKSKPTVLKEVGFLLKGSQQGLLEVALLGVLYGFIISVYSFASKWWLLGWLLVFFGRSAVSVVCLVWEHFATNH